MRYSGSFSHFVDMLARYLRVKVADESSIDQGDCAIDRRRRLIGLIMFVIFIGIPAVFLLLWTYCPAFARWVMR